MLPMQIAPNIYDVGVQDWAVRDFHGYKTERGATYNSYLIMDEKITLIDTVKAPFAEELLQNISRVTPLESIDYIVINHVEPDHSGAMPALAKACPKAKFIISMAGKNEAIQHYGDIFDFEVVKDGATLNIGKRSLVFAMMTMLHWPDSMATYCVEDKILFSNDAFGEHYATSKRFDDEVDDNAVEMIQSMLLKGFADKIRISRRKNMNYIDIITKKNPQMTLYVTLSSIVLAVIMGVCMRLFLSESITGALCSMVLNPIKTIYMNLLSMVVGPVVFFSLITCMIQFSDLRSFGRIGGKTMGIYMFTSLVAGVTGIGVFYLLQPGTEGSFVSMITTGASSGASISLLDTIIDIFPSNVVGAFYENNVLQILLMGLILGVMINMIGEKGKVLQNIFDSLNELFLQLVMVSIILPIRVLLLL